ncbi:4-hydroxyphenylpyruvate dioxygenase [Streptomyces sp. TLI_053]|uniref:4-hydroxyphenylpyruvate dioxygenase n=1 Tax=Streptomyces sp. TLI_053 TaxID=1855352 RepID=UPI00087AAF0E|nr:4-hydroxyphenylpyruvate dioxygenase [Streptomyces sp. TLI_053]SDT44150.1 4-hydroxyphenylpyruvate dioxygenase [Streptomyces sp. TLI_053]
MGVRDIEYVELYTSEPKPALDYFVEAMGFTPVAESAERGADSTALRCGGVRIVVTSGRGTEAFLDAHGDGIADVALGTDDVDATYRAALDAGARPVPVEGGGPAVACFGDVRHSLVPVAGDRWLPAGREWKALDAAAGRPERIRSLDHIAVCLEAGTLAGTTDFYLRALGLERYSSEYVAFGDQAMDSIVVRSATGGATFTLIEPDPAKQAGQIDRFMERNSGPGVQHLAFLVDDIVPAVHEFRARGVDFLSTPAAYYDMLAERLGDLSEEIADLQAAHVLADRDEWGHLLQLFTRSPYERNSLFFELIQRRGSRGFGSANIRALYEAVERDRVVAE